MALYFECRINKNALLLLVFFGDFAHWERDYYVFAFYLVFLSFRYNNLIQL